MVFFWETIALLVPTAIFFVVSFAVFNYWKETKETIIVLPAVFTFEFFIVLFFAVFAISLTIRYTPALLDMLGV